MVRALLLGDSNNQSIHFIFIHCYLTAALTLLHINPHAWPNLIPYLGPSTNSGGLKDLVMSAVFVAS